MNPSCSRHFVPTRSWQRYCCKRCRRMGEAEMVRIGEKAASALLAWRMGKYERKDAALRALSRAGRNYVSRLSADWWADRQRRPPLVREALEAWSLQQQKQQKLPPM